MPIESIRPYLETALVLWNIVLSAAIWLRKPGLDAAAALTSLRDELVRRLGDHDHAIGVINTRMDAMPTSEELTALEGTVGRIDERTKGLENGITTLQACTTRIETYLLNSKS